MKYIVGVMVSVVVALGMWGQTAQAADGVMITRFEAEYHLSRSVDQRSQLKTVEKITVSFPEGLQKHGIERALPKGYDGHSIGLSVESVMDERGAAQPFTTYNSNDNEVLRIGDKNRFASGTKTYVVTYRSQDVTKAFDGHDEFYWDVNGTEWREPVVMALARVYVAPDMVAALNGDMACYQGVNGATDRCTISRQDGLIEATAGDLNPGHTMTMAIGFRPGTFAEYQPSLVERLLPVWIVMTVVTTLLGIVLLVWVLIVYSKRSNRTSEIGTVVPEYLPPKHASVLLSAQIGGSVTGPVVTAQIIDLAVRHYVKVYQTKEKALFSSAEYELEISKEIETLDQEERVFVATLFGEGNTAVGSRFAMKKMRNDYKMIRQLQNNDKATQQRIRSEYALRHKDADKARWFGKVMWVTGVLGVVLLAPMLLFVAVVAAICQSLLTPLTDKGLKWVRYLNGLKLYIEVAEEERLKFLQSPQGAEKKAVVMGDDTKQLVVLYERVLPYAILFGQEKEWNKQLGQYYAAARAEPDWYVGQTAFSAAAFSSAMGDFGSTLNSYGVSSSSSTGGSSGGGSAGGGGGGGGGGSW